jgi:hypothetical protein
MDSDHVPAYVPGFEHDVFISYARVDDTPEFGPLGWVSTFVDLLQKRLARLLGRPDCFSLWMDRGQLSGASLLTPGLEHPLKTTAVMVAFLSTGYLESSWCPKERDVFVKAIGPEAGDCARIFVVEMDALDPERLPKEFADRLRYKFWDLKPGEKYPRRLGEPGTGPDPNYLSYIDALARELVEVLRRMKERAQGGTKLDKGDAQAPLKPIVAKAQPIVYLAEVTEDLDSLWWKVKGYLEQQRIGVVPRQYLPRDPDAFRQAVVSNLADADLFVQLLSNVPGRQMDESRTYAAFQHALAREVGLPVVQWRDPVLTEHDLAEIESATHRELLAGSTVQAVQIEEFKQDILHSLERLRAEREKQERIAQKSQEAAQGKANDKFVFIVADTKDEVVARSLFEYIGQQGYPCGLPIALEDRVTEITPAEIRQDFEENVQSADGTVIVYGQTPVVWYRSQLTAVRKIQAQYQRNGKRSE